MEVRRNNENRFIRGNIYKNDFSFKPLRAFSPNSHWHSGNSIKKAQKSWILNDFIFKFPKK